MSNPKRCGKCPAEARHLYKDQPYCSTCINAVPADAPITSIEFRRRGARKKFTEMNADKNYSGEASPYWDHVHTSQDTTGEGMGVLEDPLANPDVLSEEDSFFCRPLSEVGETMLRAIHDTMNELTEQQKSLIQLAIDGVPTTRGIFRTEEALAEKTGMSRRSVRECLNRAKAKIRRQYEKLKTAEKL